MFKKDGREKRKATRVPASLEVDYSTYTPYDLRRIINISQGGVYIRTQELLPVGSELEIRFNLPNYNRPINSKVKVMWTYRQPSVIEMNSSGMGVQFLQIADQDLQAIEEFIEQIKATP